MVFLQIYLPILIFIIGVCLASFGNVLICRYPNWKLSGEEKYSECPKCHHRLAWYDLFPIFSFLFLRGKCRYCHEKISRQYITVELSGGLLFLAIYFLYVYVYHFNSTNMEYAIGPVNVEFTLLSVVKFITFSFAALILLLASYIDHKHKEVPFTFSIGLLVLALIHWGVQFAYTKNYGLNTVLGLAIPFVLFGLIYFISVVFFKVEPIGLGDVIVFMAVGFLLGAIQFVIVLIVSCVLCSIVETIKIKKTGQKDTIPFIPYIFVGFLVSVLAGELISYGYFHLLGVK